MPESLFSSLLQGLDRSNISQIATSMGESERCIFGGMESSIACVLAAMTAKADSPSALRGMLDLAPEAAEDGSWPRLITSLTMPGSAWIAKGKDMLSALFGANGATVSNAISAQCGVKEGTATTLLAMATPVVLRFLTKRVTDEGWSMRTLANMLHRESRTIRASLPSGVSDPFWPRASSATDSSVIAQPVRRERSASIWLGALGLIAFALGALWFLTHLRKPTTEIGTAVTGEASRRADEDADYVNPRPPKRIELNLPTNGAERQLADTINGTNTIETNPSSRTTWPNFDRLVFDSGSSTLPVDSAEQLDNVAAILKEYPNVKIAIGGFTDNVGTAASNLQLSRSRAEAVKEALVSRGIDADRLITEGFGKHSPLANNADPNGRAQNRRASLHVAAK